MNATHISAGSFGSNQCSIHSSLRVEDLSDYDQAVAHAIQVSKTDLTKMVIPSLFADRDTVVLDLATVTKLLNAAHDFGVVAGRRAQQVLSMRNAGKL